MSMVDTDIQILDKSFTIKCPSEQQTQLLESAAYLDQKMREIKGHNQLMNLERVAVLAALNTTYELLFQEKQLPDAQIIADKVQSLQSLLQEFLAR